MCLIRIRIPERWGTALLSANSASTIGEFHILPSQALPATGGKKLEPVPVSKHTQNTNKMNKVINMVIILDENT